MTRIPNLDGSSQIYAVFGDPIGQVQTPSLINPLFAKYKKKLFAVPFHVTPGNLKPAWGAFRSFSNLAGIGVTVPHKVNAAELCDTLTPAAKAVGVVNSIQRSKDGKMYGALFDGLGFVRGLGDNRNELSQASVLLIGAGGAGRAIAHALVAENIARLTIIDANIAAADFTIGMINELAGEELAKRGPAEISQYDFLINATPIGLKPSDIFPIELKALHRDVFVADIASLAHETALLSLAKSLNCKTSDGGDMLKAQIALIAGFASGAKAGEPIG